MKTRRTGPILVAIATIFSLSAVVAPAGAAQAKDSDDALVAAGGTLMQENLTAGQDQDSFTAQADTTTTTLPQQPSSGIVLDGKDPTAPETAIGLPYADAADEAQPSDLGGVTYDNNNDSTTTALPKSDGSLQIATTITSAQGPSDYTYTITGSEGSHLQLEDNGMVSLLSADGNWEGGAAPPWAKDANGNPVDTTYSVDGNTLTQHIAFDETTAFPVVADPWWGTLIDHTEWADDLWEWSPTLMVYPTWWGRVAGGAISTGPGMTLMYREFGWQETLDKTEREGHPDPDTSSMRNQFYCHWDWVRAAQFYKSSWNLDTGLPDKGYFGFLDSGCN